jgi:hypothetical protein
MMAKRYTRLISTLQGKDDCKRFVTVNIMNDICSLLGLTGGL